MNTSQEGLLVVIAEDDPMTRRLLERMIEKWGYRPLAVDSGERAWELLQALPVHVLVTDWDMPGMSGIELCEHVKASNRERYTYTLMITHHEDRNRLVRALEAGADDFVSKPVHPLELQARLKVASRIVNLERELRKSQRRLEAVNLQLVKQATTDALMGIGNRRAFDEALGRVYAWSLEHGTKFGVLLCDIDKFKQYNDTYGHQAGDKVLATVGGVLQDQVRGGDDVFRYGGEEIVVLLQRCQADGVRIVGERLRKSVRNLAIEHDGGPEGYVTVSVGATLFDPEEEPLPGAAQVVKRADEALYEAKGTGRNRVVFKAAPSGIDRTESH